MPRAPRKATYADRTLYQLISWGAQSFHIDELVDGVVDEVIRREEKLTRLSKTCIEKHILYLRICRLLRRDKEDKSKLHIVDPLASEIDRIRRRVPDLSPGKLKDIATLVRIGAYPKKRTTVKELTQQYLEIRDERDELEDKRNELEEERDELRRRCSELEEERDALMRKCAALEAEATRDRSPLAPQWQVEEGPEAVPMDIDDVDTPAGPSANAEIQSRHAQAMLRRTPTLEYIDPVTPARKGSGLGSQFSLLTPPPSDERLQTRISRNDCRRSQQSIRHWQDVEDTRLPVDALGPRPSTPVSRSTSLLDGAQSARSPPIHAPGPESSTARRRGAPPRREDSHTSVSSAEGDDPFANFDKSVRRASRKLKHAVRDVHSRDRSRERARAERAELELDRLKRLFAQRQKSSRDVDETGSGSDGHEGAMG